MDRLLTSYILEVASGEFVDHWYVLWQIMNKILKENILNVYVNVEKITKYRINNKTMTLLATPATTVGPEIICRYVH